MASDLLDCVTFMTSAPIDSSLYHQKPLFHKGRVTEDVQSTDLPTFNGSAHGAPSGGARIAHKKQVYGFLPLDKLQDLHKN